MLFVLALSCFITQALCGASEASKLIIHEESTPTRTTAYGTFSIEQPEIIRRTAGSFNYDEVFNTPVELKSHEKKMFKTSYSPQTLQALSILHAVAVIRQWPHSEQEYIRIKKFKL